MGTERSFSIDIDHCQPSDSVRLAAAGGGHCTAILSSREGRDGVAFVLAVFLEDLPAIVFLSHMLQTRVVEHKPEVIAMADTIRKALCDGEENSSRALQPEGEKLTALNRKVLDSQWSR